MTVTCLRPAPSRCRVRRRIRRFRIQCKCWGGSAPTRTEPRATGTLWMTDPGSSPEPIPSALHHGEGPRRVRDKQRPCLPAQSWTQSGNGLTLDRSSSSSVYIDLRFKLGNLALGSAGMQDDHGEERKYRTCSSRPAISARLPPRSRCSQFSPFLEPELPDHPLS